MYSTNWLQGQHVVGRKTAHQTHTTRVPPATTEVLILLWGPPLPRPLELYRRDARGVVVAYQGDVGVLVQVWIGMEFSRDQLFDFSRVGSENIRQARQVGVDAGHGGRGDEVVAHGIYGTGLELAKDAGEVEGELVFVGQT